MFEGRKLYAQDRKQAYVSGECHNLAQPGCQLSAKAILSIGSRPSLFRAKETLSVVIVSMQQFSQYNVLIKNWRFLPDRISATPPLRLIFHATFNTATYAFAQERPLLLYCEQLDLELPPLSDGSQFSLTIQKANSYQFVAINYPRLKLRVQVKEQKSQKISQQLTISEFDSISAQDFKQVIQRICTDQHLKGFIVPCFDSIINQQISLKLALPASESDTNCSQEERPKKKKNKRVARFLRGLKAVEWALELSEGQLNQTQKISEWLSLRLQINE